MDENIKILGLAGLILMGTVLIVGMMVAPPPVEGGPVYQWRTLFALAGVLMGAVLLVAASRSRT